MQDFMASYHASWARKRWLEWTLVVSAQGARSLPAASAIPTYHV